MMGGDRAARTLEFLRGVFGEFYEEHPIPMPDRFSRREFAFILWGGKGMVRHLAFERRERFEGFLVDRAPQHAYYSSAYYQAPAAAKMQEKKWMGAELIFDLDSDHLPGAEAMTYEESLLAVKRDFVKLVEEFMLGDLGFSEKYVSLYFSGGRGYHCHVRDPAILDLDSSERRELVDYITARDLQDDVIFHERVTDRKSFKGQTFAGGKSLQMPSPQEPGWKGRISRGIIDIVEEIASSPDPIERLQAYGVKEKDAERLVAELSEERLNRIRGGLLDQTKTIRKFFLNGALRKTAVSLSAGETDEPVTCDVKRLIRLPGSLHGKTGFQVVPIPLHGLDRFDPLRDAVVLPDTPVQVQVEGDVTASLKGEQFSLTPGVHEVPLYLAVFLLGRRQASLLDQDQ
jgi:DNA primase small subunit